MSNAKRAVKSETLQANIVKALQSRIDAAPNANQADNLTAERKFFEGSSALAMIEKCKALEIDFQALARKFEIADKSNSDFVAVYALQKIRKALFALALNSRASFDKYSNSIIQNLCDLQDLNTKHTRMSICNAIEFDELEQVRTIKRYHNCSESTASTQSSSTRMMLNYLNICAVAKGRKNDVMTFADTLAAKQVQTMFA